MGFSRKIKYGWRRDLPDPRDYLYKVVRTEPLPKSICLVDYCSPVFDQSTLGSCTACSGVASMEFLEIKNGIHAFEPLSPLFVYYNSRLLEHSTNSDDGATIRDMVKSLNKWGACSLEVCPYNIKRFKNKPSKNAYVNGAKHKATQYIRLSTLQDMRTCLASGYCFVFGISIFESFESEEVAKNGIVNMPAANESLLGGHAVCAVGYDDNEKRFYVKNSWGTDWGMKLKESGTRGYFSIPYAYLTDKNLASDFWIIKNAEGF